MKVIYASLTNKTAIFAKKLKSCLQQNGYDIEFIKMNPKMTVEDEFVLITYTFGHGEVPASVNRFLNENYCNLIGVIGTGDKAWGIDRYNKASEIISNKFNIPILHQLEKQGFPQDVEYATKRIIQLQKGEILNE